MLRTLRSVLRLRRIELDAVERRLASVASVEDLRRIARRRLPGGVFDYIDGDGPITTTTGELPTNFALPQPKTNACPACEIATGGPKIRLNTSSKIAPLAPHHVVVTRMGRGKNPPCSPLVIDLGDLTLSSTRITEISSPAFGPDSCRVKAEVDITYTDAAGAMAHDRDLLCLWEHFARDVHAGARVAQATVMAGREG